MPFRFFLSSNLKPLSDYRKKSLMCMCVCVCARACLTAPTSVAVPSDETQNSMHASKGSCKRKRYSVRIFFGSTVNAKNVVVKLVVPPLSEVCVTIPRRLVGKLGIKTKKLAPPRRKYSSNTDPSVKTKRLVVGKLGIKTKKLAPPRRRYSSDTDPSFACFRSLKLTS